MKGDLKKLLWITAILAAAMPAAQAHDRAAWAATGGFIAGAVTGASITAAARSPGVVISQPAVVVSTPPVVVVRPAVVRRRAVVACAPRVVNCAPPVVTCAPVVVAAHTPVYFAPRRAFVRPVAFCPPRVRVGLGFGGCW